MFPPKKKGLDVVIAVGKPKGGPPPLSSPGETDEPEDPKQPDQSEPDADEAGGPSDQDADNGGHDVMQYAHEIGSQPGGAELLGAICKFLKGGGEDSQGY